LGGGKAILASLRIRREPLLKYSSHEVVTILGALFNSDCPTDHLQISRLSGSGRADAKPLHCVQDFSAARLAALSEQLIVFNASTDQEIEAAFAERSRRRIGALLVGTDIFLNSRTEVIPALANSHGILAIYGFRRFALAGGLMSYGTNETEQGRIAGLYTGRILNGEKPGDLPVQQSTKVELVINLKAAKALSLEIPPQLLARADEVIE
jgi:ABC-type uncharacterized transport system substrate-binding protein